MNDFRNPHGDHMVPDIREIEALSRRVQHIDSSNAELSARMSGIESSVNSLVTAVDKIMDKVSAPPQTTNWQAIIGAMMLVFTLAASYSNLSVGPLRESLAMHSSDLKALNSVVSSAAAETNSAKGRVEGLYHWSDKLDANVLTSAQRLSSLEAQVLALKESIHGRNP